MQHILMKIIHEVKSIITFESSDNYSCIQQNSTCNVESAQKHKNARGAREIAFAAFCLSHNSFAECFTEKKNIQHFHHPTTYYYSRESKSRWYATAIRIDYVACLYEVSFSRSFNAGVRNAWRPENELSLVYRKLRHLTAGDRDLYAFSGK